MLNHISADPGPMPADTATVPRESPVVPTLPISESSREHTDSFEQGSMTEMRECMVHQEDAGAWEDTETDELTVRNGGSEDPEGANRSDPSDPSDDVATSNDIVESEQAEAEHVPHASVGQETVEDRDAGDHDSQRAAILARAEAAGLFLDYPDLHADDALSDPVLGPLLRGEVKPSLRRLLEPVECRPTAESHMEALTDLAEAAVSETVSTMVSDAVRAAVEAEEEKLLAHIRVRGRRPQENGTASASGIRMHPAVDRLTRRERAMLAERAGRGETIRL